MSDSTDFLFVTCQVGAEATLKRELARYRPSFRFAYSRPGFLTFKLPPNHGLADDFDLKSIFARSYGFSLGKAAGEKAEGGGRKAEEVRNSEFGIRSSEAAPAEPPSSEHSPLPIPHSPFEPSPAATADVWRLASGKDFRALHVWPRDVHAPGDHDYEPGQNDTSRAVDAELRRTAPPEFAHLQTARPTESGDLVLDVVVLEPQLWWVGYHRASTATTRRPGGIFDDVVLPYEAVSRAWLKMEEALRWSNLPVRRGDTACEIGCAPGGSCQALLGRGLNVLGIDPAEMHPAVLDHPNFRHLRMRGADVRRRELRGVRWLTTDMNVAPNYTLDTVEGLVTHDEVEIEGMLLTLKLLDWKQADAVEDYRARVQSWGFTKIRMRQLQHNRREFCLFAIR